MALPVKKLITLLVHDCLVSVRDLSSGLLDFIDLYSGRGCGNRTHIFSNLIGLGIDFFSPVRENTSIQVLFE